MFKKLWHDDAGILISLELMVLGTVLVIGLLVGLAAFRDAITNELADVSSGISRMNQSFSVRGVSSPSASVAGHSHVDVNEFDDRQRPRPTGIEVNPPTAPVLDGSD